MRWRKQKDEDGSSAPTASGTSAADQQPAPAPADAVVEEPTPTRPDVPVALGAVDDDAYATTVRRVVAKALSEDLAGSGDATSLATVPLGTRGRAQLVAREAGVVAGVDVVTEVAAQVDHRIEVRLDVADGDSVAEGQVLGELEGPLRGVLTAERTLLNLLCQLSGVATTTRAFATLLEGLDCVVRDTRKTTPGLRLLEKRAVAAGGGANHRIGLHDAILVKDNHVAAAGGVGAATTAALAAPGELHVQIEVTTLAEAEEAIAAGATDLLLDNFSPEDLRQAIEAIDGRAAVEASGGITLETARAYAEAGADRLAVGALTHSAPALDLALDVVEVVPRTAGGGLRVVATTPPAPPAPDAEAVAEADDAVAAPEDTGTDESVAPTAASADADGSADASDDADGSADDAGTSGDANTSDDADASDDGRSLDDEDASSDPEG